MGAPVTKILVVTEVVIEVDLSHAGDSIGENAILALCANMIISVLTVGNSVTASLVVEKLQQTRRKTITITEVRNNSTHRHHHPNILLKNPTKRLSCMNYITCSIIDKS